MTAQLNGIAIHPARYSTLGDAFQTPVHPQALPAPYWVCRNAALAREIGLSDDWLHNHDTMQEVLETLTGNNVPTGLQPTASVYSGHQFGQWAGQLGDGRALSLGQFQNGLEVQLKGAGRTPTRAVVMAALCCAAQFANFYARRPCTAWASPPPALCV